MRVEVQVEMNNKVRFTDIAAAGCQNVKIFFLENIEFLQLFKSNKIMFPLRRSLLFKYFVLYNSVPKEVTSFSNAKFKVIIFY